LSKRPRWRSEAKKIPQKTEEEDNVQNRSGRLSTFKPKGTSNERSRPISCKMIGKRKTQIRNTGALELEFASSSHKRGLKNKAVLTVNGALHTDRE